jgi:uncharacterized membrane protein YgdD (TMEM256/DUF423 family)
MANDPLLQRALSRIALATIAFAALTGAGAVMLGALAGHGLEETAARLARIASHYALVHAAVLIGVALIFDRTRGWARHLMTLAIILFATGIIGFCGGLVFLAFEINAWGPQLGGMALITAWITLAAAAICAFCTRQR